MRHAANLKSPEFDLERPLESARAVLRAVLLSPRRFYLGFSADGPIREPAAFVLLVSAVTAALSTVVVLVSGALFAEVGMREVGATVLQAILFTLLSPAAVGVAAAVYLLSIRTFVGKVSNLREVYRMLAYAYSVMVVAWIPLAFAFAFTYALMVLMPLGIRGVYRTSTLTAIITSLVGFMPVGVGVIWFRLAVAGPLAG
jgi:hypothetical protein